MIKLITGPMGAGKSEVLIENFHYFSMRNQTVIAFKPKSDTRVKNIIRSRNGLSIPALEVSSFNEIINEIKKDEHIDCVIIDEVQFFDFDGFIDLFHLCQSRNISVFLGGIDLTSELHPFTTIEKISPFCTSISKLTAHCGYCGQKAHYTLCTVPKDGEVLIGDNVYVASCYKCYNAHRR